MITYHQDKKITANEYIQILIESTLGERRPIDDYQKIVKMVEHADILITAWDKDKLVGVVRSLSDFSFFTYLGDLAVHIDYQHQGIGKELIKRTRNIAGTDHILLLTASPAAKDYYEHIGFKKSDRTWILLPNDKLNQ